MAQQITMALSKPQWITILEAMEYAQSADRDALRSARRHRRDDDSLALELQAIIKSQQEIIETIQSQIAR